MNKAQFIAYLAPQFGDSKKEAARAVEVVFDAIIRNISKGEDVMINDFGKFKKVDRPARKGRNPFTGETIQIKASKKVRFLPAKGLKDVISGAKKLGAAPVAPAKAAPAKASKPAKAAKATKAKKVSKLKKAVKKAKPAKKAKAKKRR
jgi:DNA-binding protein HU-beta